MLPEVCLIGWPLQRTFSPQMQNAALQAVNLDWRYESIPLPPEDLPDFMSRLTTAIAIGRVRGIQVTIPHKEAVRSYCFKLDKFAAVSGAVNTAVPLREDGRVRLEGHNTDAPGLLKALNLKAGFETRGCTAMVLGAGGAAAGSLAALATSGASRIIVANRTPSRAAGLVQRMRAAFPGIDWSYAPLTGESPTGQPLKGLPPSGRIDLVLNCIPAEPASQLGCFVENAYRDGAVFCDLSYSHAPTKLMEAAKTAGYRVVPGIEVLLWQGVYGFEIFARKAAPVEAMRKALVQVAGNWWVTY